MINSYTNDTSCTKIVGYGSNADVSILDPTDIKSMVKLDKYNPEEKMVVKRSHDHQRVGGCLAVRELDLLIKLNHPSVVPIRGFYFIDEKESKGSGDKDCLNLVFPQALGTLEEIMEDLEPKEVLSILVDILLGLEFIHLSGYIHCDIKPKNILIFEEKLKLNGVRFRASICDFGSARSMKGDSMTPCITTECYGAPEQYLRSDYNQSIDMWSFGCLVYAILTKNEFTHHATKYSWPNSLLDRILFKLPKCPPIDEIQQIYYKNRNKVSYRGEEIQAKYFKNDSSWIDHLIYIDSNLSDSDGEDSVNESVLDFCLKVCGGEHEIEKFLGGLICFDYSKRLSATDVLNLPMFSSYRQKINEYRLNYPHLSLDILNKKSWKNIATYSNIIEPSFEPLASNMLINYFGERVRNIYKANNFYCAGVYFMAIQIMEQVLDNDEYINPKNKSDLFSLLMTCLKIGARYHSRYDIENNCYYKFIYKEDEKKDIITANSEQEKNIIKLLAGNISRRTIYDDYIKTKNIKNLTNLFSRYIKC